LVKKGLNTIEPKNLGIDQELFNYIVKTGNGSYYYNLIGMKIGAIGPGYAEVWTKAKQAHTNPLGIVHGGVYVSLADAAMGTAMRSLGVAGVTINLTTSFLDSVNIGTSIVAIGRVLKKTNKIIYTEAKVMADEKLLTDVQAAFYKTQDLNWQELGD
jgi:uncharacterized protein (TIGR00369 family)